MQRQPISKNARGKRDVVDALLPPKWSAMTALKIGPPICLESGGSGKTNRLEQIFAKSSYLVLKNGGFSGSDG